MEEKRLNILQIHNYYQIHGGEDTVAENEKILLEKRGHKVYTYKRYNSEIKNMSFFENLLLPFAAIFSIKSYREVSKIISNNEVDIIHVHNTLMLVSPSVFFAAFRHKKPIVQTVHNFRMLCPAGSFFRDGKICEECGKGKLLPAIKHRCYRESFLQSTVSAAILQIHRILKTYQKVYYICITSFNKKKLLQLNQGKRRVIDPKKIYVKPNFTLGTSKSQEKPEYYLWVGRLEPLKGIMLAVEAFGKMPQKKLVVVGDGPQKEQVVKYISDNGIKNIQLEGYTQRDGLEEKYAKAKALIVTSQCYETFGLVIAEAYSHGVPAIVSDIGNISAMVENGVTGLKYQYNSEQALIQAVETFDNIDPQILSENARKMYEENFKADNNVKQLETIYYEIIEDYALNECDNNYNRTNKR